MKKQVYAAPPPMAEQSVTYQIIHTGKKDGEQRKKERAEKTNSGPNEKTARDSCETWLSSGSAVLQEVG